MARGHLRFPSDEVKEQEALEERDEAAAAWGLRIETQEQQAEAEDEFWLWPENVETFGLWCALQTQWRVGMGGATGLDYNGVQAGMNLMAIRNKDKQKHFPALQAMERATLDEWSKKKR